MVYGDYRVRPVECNRKKKFSYYRPGRRSSVTETTISRIIDLYDNGMKRSAIARELNLSRHTVTQCLKQNGKFFESAGNSTKSNAYPFDGLRYRVARLCRKYALIDKISPRWSNEKIHIEEIVAEDTAAPNLVSMAKKLDTQYKQEIKWKSN